MSSLTRGRRRLSAKLERPVWVCSIGKSTDGCGSIASTHERPLTGARVTRRWWSEAAST